MSTNAQRTTILACLLTLTGTAAAGAEEGTNVKKPISAGAPYPYGHLEYLPIGFAAQPTRKWPLFVFLHGGGDTGDGSAAGLEHVDNVGPGRNIVMGTDFPGIVVHPQMSNEWDVAKLDQLITYFKTTYPGRIDDDRVYMGGFSRGGIGAWRYATTHPNKLAAITVFAGAGSPNSTYKPSALVGIEVWAFHHYDDNQVDRASTTDRWLDGMVDALPPAHDAPACFAGYDNVAGTGLPTVIRTGEYSRAADAWTWRDRPAGTGTIRPRYGVNPRYTVFSNNMTGENNHKDLGHIYDNGDDLVIWDWLFRQHKRGLISQPYTDLPIALPGTIQAEEYDLGVDGVGYHDTTTGNSGGQLRTDGVDIAASTDTGGGHDVVDFTTGEWLHYSVDIQVDTNYTLVLRYKAAATAQVRLSIDGVDLGEHTLTGGSGYRDHTISGLGLPQGGDLLKIEVTAGTLTAFNKLTANAEQTPYYYSPITLPARIQLEDFDRGGEGVAYHDTDARNQGAITQWLGDYRSEGVDTASVAKAGEVDGGYVTGWEQIGEWLEYTVTMPSAGTLPYTFRYKGGGKIRFYAQDGTTARSAQLTLTSSGSWTTADGTISLPAGQQVIRLAIEGTGFNANWVQIGTPVEKKRTLVLSVRDSGGTAVSSGLEVRQGGVLRYDASATTHTVPDLDVPTSALAEIVTSVLGDG